MNRVINIGILLLLALFISFRVHVAFSELRSVESIRSGLPFDLPVTFNGIVPCTTCVGIDYTLTLENDRYLENNIYIEDEMGTIQIEGIWDFRSDTLYLYIEEILTYKTFLWEKNEMSLLNSMGSKRGVQLSIKVD